MATSRGNSVTLTLTVTNGAYTIGDVVGGLLTFAGATASAGGHSVINSVELCGVSALAYNLEFYKADLATPNVADNGTYTLAAADGLNYQGRVQITAADYVPAANSFNNACVKGQGKQIATATTSTTLYGYLVATATTTPGTTTIYLTVDFEYLD